MKYHVNGELVDDENATVSVRDRGFQYGDAAFETLRAYGGQLFAWSAHQRRLEATCDALSLEHGISGHDLRGRIHETLTANALEDAYVRLSITRGVHPGRLAPPDTVDPTVVVVTEPLPRSGVSGEQIWDAPATARTVDTRHVPEASIPAVAKTHNYLDGILARIDAGDADEAILLDTDGHVTEGTISNVFFVADGVLHTPSLDLPVLPGITRWTTIELAADLGIPVEEGRYEPDTLRNATELFLTNTTWEIRPVAALDGAAFETFGVGRRLARAFAEVIEDSHY